MNKMWVFDTPMTLQISQGAGSHSTNIARQAFLAFGTLFGSAFLVALGSMCYSPDSHVNDSMTFQAPIREARGASGIFLFLQHCVFDPEHFLMLNLQFLSLPCHRLAT